MSAKEKGNTKEYWGGRLLVAPKPNRKNEKTVSEKSFSVASYNILAQCYVNVPKYPYCKPALLKWHHRRQCLLEEIQDLQCDIICLQEVDNYDTWWMPKLEALGYDSVYAKRGGDRQDGVCISYRRDIFQLFRSDHIDFNTVDSYLTGEEDNAKNCKNNVALVAALQPWEESTHPSAICVVSAHLYSPRSTEGREVQLKQLRTLLGKISDFNADFQLPIVMNGSFNFYPNSKEYQIVTSGCEPARLSPPSKINVLPQATAISRSQVHVSWTVPHCGDAPIERFIVRRCAGRNRGAGFENEVVIENPNDTEVTVCGLSSGVSYEFTVCAVSAVGEADPSEPSKPVATFLDIANPPANVHLKHDAPSNSESKTAGESKGEEGKHQLDVEDEVDLAIAEFGKPRVENTRQTQRRKKNGKRIHHLRLGSAYQFYNNGGEPSETCSTEKFKACVDFMFYTRDSLTVTDVLSMPDLRALEAQDPRRQQIAVDQGDAKPSTWDCEAKLSVFDVKEGKTKETDNPSFMGEWVPHQLRDESQFHSWLPNQKFSSDHTALRATFAFEEDRLATNWN